MKWERTREGRPLSPCCWWAEVRARVISNSVLLHWPRDPNKTLISFCETRHTRRRGIRWNVSPSQTGRKTWSGLAFYIVSLYLDQGCLLVYPSEAADFPPWCCRWPACSLAIYERLFGTVRCTMAYTLTRSIFSLRQIKQVESLVTHLQTHHAEKQQSLNRPRRHHTNQRSPIRHRDTASSPDHDGECDLPALPLPLSSYSSPSSSPASPTGLVTYSTMTSTPSDFPQDGPSVKTLLSRFQTERRINGSHNNNGTASPENGPGHHQHHRIGTVWRLFRGTSFFFPPRFHVAPRSGWCRG